MSEEDSLAGDVQAYRQALAGRPFAFVAKQAGHKRAAPVQNVDLDCEQDLTDLGAAAIDDDDDVAVGVVSGVTSGAGTEEHDLANSRAEPPAHLSREFDGYRVRPGPGLHTGMLARGAEQAPMPSG